MQRSRLLVLFISLLGCGEPPSEPPCSEACTTDGGVDESVDAGAPDAGVDAGVAEEDADPPSDVTGTWLAKYVTEQGKEVVPLDLSSWEFSAAVPSRDGGFETVPGAGSDAGTFRVPSVPGGLYYLQRRISADQPLWLWISNERVFDLDAQVLGRADTVYDYTPRPVNLALSGLLPWGANDELRVFSSNAGYLCEPLKSLTSAGPDAGATAVALTFDYALAYSGPALIDAAKGDETWITQLRSASAPGTLADGGALAVPYLAVAAHARVTTFSAATGTTLSAALSTDAGTTSMTIDWRRSEWLSPALARQVNPVAVPIATDVRVSAQPAITPNEYYTAVAPNVLRITAPPLEDSDVRASYTFNNPYPSTWTLAASATTVFEVQLVADTDAGTIDYGTWHGQITDVAAGSFVDPLRPRLTPIRNLTIAGRDGFRSQSGVGTSPRIEWQPPAVGSPTAYRLWITRLSGGGPVPTAGVVQTDFTSFIMPPGVLEAGVPYVLTVTAQEGPTSSRPNAQPFPARSATAISGVFIP